jgi:hypothetical protein
MARNRERLWANRECLRLEMKVTRRGLDAARPPLK